jgi:hypothetical protein
MNAKGNSVPDDGSGYPCRSYEQSNATRKAVHPRASINRQNLSRDNGLDKIFWRESAFSMLRKDTVILFNSDEAARLSSMVKL